MIAKDRNNRALLDCDGDERSRPALLIRRQTTHAINPAAMLTELLNKPSGKIVV
jgi:hypothetical protein